MKLAYRCVLMVTLLTLLGCDMQSQSRRRAVLGYTAEDKTSTTSAAETAAATTTPSGTPTATTTSETESASASSSSSYVQLSAEFANCPVVVAGTNTRYRSENTFIGPLTVCISSERGSTKVVYQGQNTYSDYPICLIPITFQGDKSSPIGTPQCFYPRSGEVKEMSFSVQSADYFMGVMIVHDKPYDGAVPPVGRTSVTYKTAYLDCLQWYSLTGQSVYCDIFVQKKQYFKVQF